MSVTSRLRLVSDVDEALALAHARVTQAAYLVGAGEGFDAAASSLQCLQLAAFLEDCGALPSADLLGEPAEGDPLSLLLAAGDALEAIPPASRPLRLGSVRAELTGAILNLPDTA